MKGLLNYWPSEDAIRDCIPHQAEALETEVFLAVHRPVTFSKRATTGARAVKQQNERQLLSAFVSNRGIKAGHLLMPIIGSSGIGKSHVIRWLYEKLRSAKDAEERHLVRVPKSASFRKALELILAGLPGHGFEDIRKILATAHDGFSQINAVESLRSHLIIACREEAEELKDALQTRVYGSNAEKRKDAHRLNHLKQMHAFLADYEVSQMLEAGKLGMIAERAIKGWRPSDEDALPEFTEDDLDLEGLAPQKMGPGACAYWKFLRDGSEKTFAADILIQNLDAAVRKLFTFGPNLHDVFLQVRETLATQNLELVLLIEDFATLTGIQAPLIDGIIATSNETTLCTVRAAIAVTDGYKSELNRDTVQTRIDHEWFIDDVPYADPALALQHVEDLVGAYLNAARYGRGALVKHLAHGHGKDDWLERYEDTMPPDAETAEYLRAFGYSPTGYSLFPFNRPCLHRLARLHLPDPNSESIRFSPRTIIKQIIHNTLWMRNAFECDAFPEEDFHNYNRANANFDDTSINHLIRQRHPEQEGRLYAFLEYWGGHPSVLSDVRSIDGLLFRAFGLPDLSDGSVKAPLPLPDPAVHTQPTGPVLPPEPVTEPESRKISQLRQALKSWRGGNILPAKQSNQIRQYVWYGIKEYINWDEFLMVEPKEKQQDTGFLKLVYLPNTVGGATGINENNALCAVCRDENLTDGFDRDALADALLALGRRHEQGNWNYPEAYLDMPRYANLMERLVPQALEYLAQHRFRADYAAEEPLCRALRLGSQALNIDGAFSRGKGERINAMFDANDVPLPQGDGEEAWCETVAAIQALRERLRTDLLTVIGARQSSGNTVYAVDATRVELSAELTLALQDVPQQLDSLRDFLKAIKPLSRLRKESSARAANLTDKFIDAFGVEFDKHAFIEEVRVALKKAATDYRDRIGNDKERLRRLLRRFRDDRVVDQWKIQEACATAGSQEQWLRAFVGIDQDTVKRVEETIALTSGFLDETAAHFDALENAHGNDGGFSDVSTAISSVIEDLCDEIDQFKEAQS